MFKHQYFAQKCYFDNPFTFSVFDNVIENAGIFILQNTLLIRAVEVRINIVVQKIRHNQQIKHQTFISKISSFYLSKKIKKNRFVSFTL